ncbi:MAG: DNA alkylation repair protein [Candidatus Pacebacteria bacterium]|jgi:3-methyladenine DNA glycosylase AlkC|nr:DNA alkylation repair protein [Candidatus Paceibacterota bacterium]
MTKKPSQKEHYSVNPETGRVSITEAFGANLAQLLAEKITPIYKKFDAKGFVGATKKAVIGKTYTQRIEIIACLLKEYLPEKYTQALAILMQILGPENKEETGMFTNFYWLMPVGKFVEKYGLDNFAESIKAIEEITKRNTGEYAIRPYARAYPAKTLAVCTRWAKSNNFHLRRLASEGLRPKLPWAPKLYLWNDAPKPVFRILAALKEDKVKFVKKSVANHVRDWRKVNPKEAKILITKWSKSKNEHTKWILKHAQR